MATPSFFKKIRHGFDALPGMIIGFISGPFLGAWYTYQSMEPRGWNFSFALSLAIFIPRLLANVIHFPFLSAYAGLHHGLQHGFLAGLSWPKHLLGRINTSGRYQDLLKNMFPGKKENLSPHGNSSGVQNLTHIIQQSPSQERPEASLSPHAQADPMTPLTSPQQLTQHHAPREWINPHEVEEKVAPHSSSSVARSDAPLSEIEYKTQEDMGQETNLTFDLKEVLTGLKPWFNQNSKTLKLQLNNANYTHVNLCGTDFSQLEPREIREFMRCIQESPVTSIWLSRTQFNALNLDQLTAFSEELSKSNIESLYLNNNNLCGLDPDLFKVLMSNIAKSKVKTLEIGDNGLHKFSPETLLALIGDLSKSRIETLSLKTTPFGPKDDTLKTAAASWKDEDIVLFMTTLGYLRQIDLSGNNFSSSQIEIFQSHSNLATPAMRHAFLMGSKAPKDPIA